jgi:hypothetical protein
MFRSACRFRPDADVVRLQYRGRYRQGRQERWRSHREGRQVMEKFIKLDGLVAPLDRANVDTDAIIPKQFLKSIKRSGFGPNAFDEWRYMDQGEPGQDCASGRRTPISCSTRSVTRVLRYCWRAATSAAARRASTRRGRCTTSAFAPSSASPLPTSFSTTASRTACCRSSCPSGNRCIVRPHRAYAGLSPDHRSAGATGRAARRPCDPLRGRRLPQGVHAQRLGRHRPDPAPCRKDPRVRGAAPHEQPWLFA